MGLPMASVMDRFVALVGAPDILGGANCRRRIQHDQKPPETACNDLNQKNTFTNSGASVVMSSHHFKVKGNH